MKMLKHVILSVLLLTLLVLPAAAQTAGSASLRIAIVDKQKLFNNYWKKQRAQAMVEEHRADFTKEIDELAKSIKTAQADYKTLVDSANDQTLSAAEREKNRTAAQQKARDFSDLKDQYEKKSRYAQATIADQAQRMSADVLTDLNGAIADQAKAKGFDLVLDSHSDAVAYAGATADLTAEVLKQLNAGAPIDLTQPAPVTGNTNSKPVITTP